MSSTNGMTDDNFTNDTARRFLLMASDFDPYDKDDEIPPSNGAEWQGVVIMLAVAGAIAFIVLAAVWLWR